MHVHCAGALLSLLNFECDPKSLAQRLECCAFNPRSMEEDLSSIVSRNESKSALLHHPFDFPRCHDVALSRVRVVFCRPFPTSIAVQILQPFTQPVSGESAIRSAIRRGIACPPQPCIRLSGEMSPPGNEWWLVMPDQPNRSSAQLHEIPSSWPRGARSRAPCRRHRQLSSCRRVGCHGRSVSTI